MSHYADNKDLFPMQGGCACGHIRYQLEMAPIMVHCCHCTACQKHTGSAFALSAYIESSAITLLSAAAPTIAGSPGGPASVSCGLMPGFRDITGGVPQPENPSSKPALHTVPSGSGIGVTIAQCPVCHVGLWSHYADVGNFVSYLRCGTLDQPWHVEPDAHIYLKSRRSFVTLSDGKPQFDEYYPDKSAMYRPDVKDRVAKISERQAQFREELMAIIAQGSKAATDGA
ncbi:hypothetical protein B0I35DRAFT_423204 [Stachybotrys elegans]|uniref:CENP-V/GFA domain-containing protein n=1 Tax=Stachybotrys elegans TaxID=80388 RepID=A0A8K0T1A6_9HYPO|nr:hypothetical protein B0I35DRAFT_423204 [Stachybotrys elegans]